MKRIFILFTILAISSTSTSAMTRLSSTDFKTHVEKDTRRSIKDSLKTGRYYLETTTTIKLVPRSEKTPKGLKKRNTTLFLRPIPCSQSDSSFVHLKKGCSI